MAALGIGAFIVALILVIVIHELAHFAVARAFGIKVQEFFVGFGPKIWSKMRGETEVGVKAIPAGGYVKIAGMNPYETVSPDDHARTFGAKPIWQRVMVIAAGPATHFALAFAFFALWLGLVGEPTDTRPVLGAVCERIGGEPAPGEDCTTIGGVPGPAFEAGLAAGDEIVGIGEVERPTTDEIVAVTQEHVGRPLEVTVLRDGREVSVTVVPVLVEEGDMICVVLPEFELVAGLVPATSDLLIRLPAGFPDTGPDMFWFADLICRSDQQSIPATDLVETYLGREWRRWSRHVGDHWRPGIDNLRSYVAYIRRALMVAAA